jgi:hypothetical protein
VDNPFRRGPARRTQWERALKPIWLIPSLLALFPEPSTRWIWMLLTFDVFNF